MDQHDFSQYIKVIIPRQIQERVVSFVYGYLQSIAIISYSGSQWLLLIALVKFGGLRAAGDFALSQALIAPVFGFLSFSLRPYWVAGVISQMDIFKFLKIRVSCLIFGSILVALFARVFIPTLDQSIFVLVLVLKNHELVSDAFYAQLDAAENSVQTGMLLLLKAFLVLVVAGWFIVIGDSERLFFGAVYATAIVVLAVEVFKSRPSWKVNLDPDQNSSLFSRELGWLIFWASSASAVTSISGFLPRYFLEAHYGREAVGYFSVVIIPASILLMVSTGLAQTELSKLSKFFHSLDWRLYAGVLKRRTIQLVGLATAGAALISVLGWLATSVLGGAIDSSIAVRMGTLMIIFIPPAVAQIFSYACMPFAQLRFTFYLSCLSLFFQALVAGLIVPKYGYLAAGAVSGLGGILQLCGFIWLIKRHFYDVRTTTQPQDVV